MFAKLIVLTCCLKVKISVKPKNVLKFAVNATNSIKFI